MGTINYGTSDYITLGARCYDLYDFTSDPGFMEDAEGMCEYTHRTLDEYIQSYIQMCYEDDYYNARDILKQYDFRYYHIEIKHGYYAGFWIDIENNYGVCYDDYTDRREAQKEVTQIKAMLQELAGCGIISVWPGWCSKEFNYAETMEQIEEAVKEMRAEIKRIPTWAQYERSLA